MITDPRIQRLIRDMWSRTNQETIDYIENETLLVEAEFRMNWKTISREDATKIAKHRIAEDTYSPAY